MLLAMEALSAFQVLVNTLSVKSKAEISTMYPCGKIHFIHIAYYFRVIVHIAICLYIYGIVHLQLHTRVAFCMSTTRCFYMHNSTVIHG